MVEYNEKTKQLYKKYFAGKKKKYIITFLSIISALIIILPSTNIIHITFNSFPGSKNPLGIYTVEFEAKNLPNGYNQHVVGNIFYSNEVVRGLWNITEESDVNDTSGSNLLKNKAPGIVLVQGQIGNEIVDSFIGKIGKETTNRWAIELAKRGFVVLSIDLPGQGYTTGTVPSIAPRADFEPFIIKNAIEYLKTLDFVNESSIGIAGVSYGATVAAMSAGVLGDYVNATVAIGGFMNFTDWLIHDNLPEEGVEFTINSTHLTINSIRGKPATPTDIQERLRFYSLLLGDVELIKKIFIPGTTSLNRTELNKMDAVNYLPNARKDSIMFIDPVLDTTFGENANQSGQGYNAAKNGAVYFPVNTDNKFLNSTETDWAMINFFKEKLMSFSNFTYNGTEGNQNYGLIINKYKEITDEQGLTYTGFYISFDVIWSTIAWIFVAMLPITGIINILFLSKKFETKRVEEEEKVPPEERMVRFYGTGVTKVVNGLIFIIGITLMILWISGSGFETYIIYIVLIPIFYIAFYYTMCYIHDDSELRKLWNIKEDQPAFPDGYNYKHTREEEKYILIYGICSILIASFIGGLIARIDSPFKLPLASYIIGIFITSIILITTSLTQINRIIKRSKQTEHQLDWIDFGLNGFFILKSFTFGVLIATNFIVFYNPVAYYLKYPYLLGLRSIYYLIVIFVAICFSVGLHIWLEVLIKYNIRWDDGRISAIKSRLVSLLLNAGLVFASGYLLSIFVFNFGVWFGPPTMIAAYIGLIFCGAYIIARLLDTIMVEKGVFASTVYIPGIIIPIIAFFLRL